MVPVTDVLDDPSTEPITEVPLASAIKGHVAFIAECASCHASQDGFDLAFFSFPDSTIIRRAVGHVDRTTALDIVAYVQSLSVDPVGRFQRVFQPGGVQLQSDMDFAMNLFGDDQWPETLTSADLAAMDVTEVPVALSFPRWSSEESNLDWMPENPFPDDLLRYADNRGADALQAYQRLKTEGALVTANIALRVAERAAGSTMAPCQLNEPARFKPAECFEARRWVASLVAQHMLREAVSEPMHHSLHDAWWDVGNAARKSIVHGRPIDNAQENWAMWMYLGWAFAPDRHASTYLASALVREGLSRHGAFHVLRTQVARRPGKADAYKDLYTAVRLAPVHWAPNVAEFSLQNLIERLEAGDTPDATVFRNFEEGMAESPLAEAWEKLEKARTRVRMRLNPEDVLRLNPLFDRVAELLPPV